MGTPRYIITQGETRPMIHDTQTTRQWPATPDLIHSLGATLAPPTSKMQWRLA